MAAASTIVVSPELKQPPAVADFLQHAVDIYHFLVSVHQPDQGNGNVLVLASPLTSLPSKLNSIVAALDQQVTKHEQCRGTLPWACRKVGQDLLLKLSRVRAHFAGTDVVTRVAFREAWPRVDVEALGDRLHDLVGRNPDTAISFKTCKIHPGPEASPITDEKRRDGEGDVYGTKMDFGEKSVMKVPRRSKVANGPVGLLQQNVPMSRVPEKPRLAPASLLYDFILESLAYKTMHDREEEVVEAHGSTFDWIYNNANKQLGHQLTTWLCSDGLGPIYWITGKPGSGKSTLMRFLFEHDLTSEYLETWANGQHVCMAGFFFWTSGSRDQRSQTGLLRSLLHQLLSSNRELIPDAFPELWQKLRVMATKERVQLSLEWPEKDLLSSFQNLMDAALPSRKICLFVDGLDEFDGDHLTMINFFKHLGMGQHGHSIKMCLSSRPWSVFENAFEHAVPHMQLQDLTHADMLNYTADKLLENMPIRRLLKKQPALREAIVDDAVQRADGVFLWVRLAVNELIAGWKPDSGADGLVSVLERLPTDLDDLFAKLLFEDRAQSELAETAMIFELVRARELVADFVRDDSANSLTVWELAFSLLEEDDPATTAWQVEQAEDQFIHHRCDTTVRQVTHRFARLLNLHHPTRQGNSTRPRFSDDTTRDARVGAAQKVTYIHRTVRDWLMAAPGIQDRLVSQSPRNFDPHLRLLRSYVLRLKRPLEEIEHHRRLDEWWPDIALALTHARHIANDPSGLLRSFVNELDKTLSWHWLDKPQDPYDHWARNAFGTYEVRMKASPIWQPFLCLATKFGLARYVSEEVAARSKAQGLGFSKEQQELQRDDATPLLAYATEFTCSRMKTIFPLSDPALVEFLLRNRCRINPGPNHEYADFMTRTPRTPWLALLRHLRDARRRGFIAYYDVDTDGTARWADIVRLFLEVGEADRQAVIVADRWDSEVTALGVLELLDETYGAVELAELKELVVGKQQGKGEQPQYALRPKNI
ncbi:NACHT nucleoside triphosphatase [Metarhizium guizhouense ARSEF 977]|uniref:NACHT nucleoside triphosphatase n=1 Tax=Metarhizium guizhouense (strain ARSEF 977) TaxID=1276136 RepID=A0A0B4HEX9_METGA|nr:NACHT nucleoside triphosphatase [Metarhizium guizhouense ARSEF 977]